MYVICQSLILLLIGQSQMSTRTRIDGYVVRETASNYVVDFTAYVGFHHPHLSNLHQFRRLTISKMSCEVDR